MSGRPVDWEPLASGDPIPGDPDFVRRAGNDYRLVASAIETAARRLREIANNVDMQSEAVEGIRTKARDLADRVGKAYDRYDGVAAALLAYAPKLEDAQALSLTARTQAMDAVADQRLAERAVLDTKVRIDTAVPGSDTTADGIALRRAQDDVQTAVDAVGAAARLLQQAVHTRDDAAEAARRLIDDAKEHDGLKDSRWDNIKGAIVDVLKTVSKILDGIAMVAGVLALFLAAVPFVGPFLGAVALWATALSLVCKLTLLALGEGDIVDVAISAAALATFGLARVASGGMMLASKGMQGVARLNAGKIAAQSKAVRAAAGLPTHSNPLRTIDDLMGAANIGKGAARAAASQAARQGPLFSRAGAERTLQTLRSIPGQSLDDLRNIRHVDLHHPISQFRGAEGAGTAMSHLGEREVGAQLRTLGNLDPRLMRTAGMTSLHGSTIVHTGAIHAIWATGASLQGLDGWRMLHPDPSSAQSLHLRSASTAGR